MVSVGSKHLRIILASPSLTAFPPCYFGMSSAMVNPVLIDTCQKCQEAVAELFQDMSRSCFLKFVDFETYHPAWYLRYRTSMYKLYPIL